MPAESDLAVGFGEPDTITGGYAQNTVASLHEDIAVVENGYSVLEAMSDLCRSIVYAVLLTDDGFELAHYAGSKDANGRFASMTSSIQALSEAVAFELSIGSSKHVILEAEDGYVIQLRVPGHPIVLAALFGNEETLGKALSTARVSAEKMASLL